MLEKVTENGYNIASAVFIFVAFREEMIFCFRVEIMSSILRATNYFSPTFCWARPSTGQENTSLAALTTVTWTRPTRLSMTMFEAWNIQDPTPGLS